MGCRRCSIALHGLFDVLAFEPSAAEQTVFALTVLVAPTKRNETPVNSQRCVPSTFPARTILDNARHMPVTRGYPPAHRFRYRRTLPVCTLDWGRQRLPTVAIRVSAPLQGLDIQVFTECAPRGSGSGSDSGAGSRRKGCGRMRVRHLCAIAMSAARVMLSPFRETRHPQQCSCTALNLF
jgi:hypothetical protein